ncbi:MAG: hypothetical protein HUU06_12880 [Planctomycetaceae bacterium]|nr:hypothetical protein [Planctomycetota bacterium]NUN53663.1 hypothetical protein [Planctomycetaceae bacterium]
MRPRPAAPVLGACLLGAFLAAAFASPAAARAPTAQERGTLDHLLRTLQADREEDAKGPKLNPLEAKIRAYHAGEGPFEDWKDVAEAARDTAHPFPLREKATSALIARYRLEVERKTDSKVINRVRVDTCRHLLKMILADDTRDRTLLQRVVEVLCPGTGVEWRPDDPLLKRQKAYKELDRKLK